MSPDRRHILALLALAPLAGCGFEPLYGSAAAGSELRNRIRVTNIEGREGFFLRERLLRRFGTPAEDAPLILDVELTTSTQGLAITQDADITRINLRGEAVYSLRASGNPEVLLTDRLIGNAGYSAPASTEDQEPIASPLAARVAEEDARQRVAEYLAEQIADRVLIAAEQFEI
ncbi:LPS assembly lipoprotein LptE [Pontivivens ytuae]|uniref:LPS-assembly lipoprotein LptE n=1 Tax=Pontivivens ytuae TaxID=2789856 RepID=A0A7S9QEQ7_9RHOB|nr:LPS assembly lipoprotein LptE [Pontivivens ytuae]QPH55446.1 hypothetical protein I0K15_06845 [Pontivivens ytuae]